MDLVERRKAEKKNRVPYCCSTRSSNKNKLRKSNDVQTRQRDNLPHCERVCPKLLQKEYKKRHDNVARAIRWNLSGKYGFERDERWYDHVPNSVRENKDIDK